MRSAALIAAASAGVIGAQAASAQSCIWTYHSAPSLSSPLSVYHGGMQRVLLLDSGAGFHIRRWEEGTGWVWMNVSGGPGGRGGAAAVYDEARNRVVLFGGNGGSTFSNSDETWLWDGAAWSKSSATGPAGRWSHAMVYDSARQRTVLFGGRAGPAAFGDTWEWDGNAWLQVASGGPPERWYPVMTYDAARGRTVLYGGIAPGSGAAIADLWEWDGAQWAERPSQLPGPHARWMVFDAARERIIMGRQTGPEYYQPYEVWEMDVHTAAWVLRHPAHRHPIAGSYDPASATVIFASMRYHPTGTLTSATITQHPQGGWFPAGSDVVLTVQAEGSAPLMYEWRRNGQPLAGGPSYSGVDTDTLTIHNLSYQSEGSFQVVVSNGCAAATSNSAEVWAASSCYPNCDGSTQQPVLNVADFTCFLQRFAAGNPYANCDQSYQAPPLNIADFSCFLVKFAAGCP